MCLQTGCPARQMASAVLQMDKDSGLRCTEMCVRVCVCVCVCVWFTE
jgi:hypothetical protein